MGSGGCFAWIAAVQGGMERTAAVLQLIMYMGSLFMK